MSMLSISTTGFLIRIEIDSIDFKSLDWNLATSKTKLMPYATVQYLIKMAYICNAVQYIPM